MYTDVSRLSEPRQNSCQTYDKRVAELLTTIVECSVDRVSFLGFTKNTKTVDARFVSDKTQKTTPSKAEISVLVDLPFKRPSFATGQPHTQAAKNIMAIVVHLDDVDVMIAKRTGPFALNLHKIHNVIK